jgi:hypothetical protein
MHPVYILKLPTLQAGIATFAPDDSLGHVKLNIQATRFSDLLDH